MVKLTESLLDTSSLSEFEAALSDKSSSTKDLTLCSTLSPSSSRSFLKHDCPLRATSLDLFFDSAFWPPVNYASDPQISMWILPILDSHSFQPLLFAYILWDSHIFQ